MRALIITPAAIKRCADLAAWAERPEHWYRPGPGVAPPGDNPAYVVDVEHGFRCVFSITVSPEGRRYRHLSISVSGPKFPHPYLAWTIASWFGFTGGRTERDAITQPAADWQMDVRREEHCFTLAQAIPEAVATEVAT